MWPCLKLPVNVTVPHNFALDDGYGSTIRSAVRLRKNMSPTAVLHKHQICARA